MEWSATCTLRTTCAATVGCRLVIMGTRSAQLAQNADGDVLTALQSPNPPRARGRALALAVCAAVGEMPKHLAQAVPQMVVVGGGKLEGKLGTRDPE